jgi:hypothetical protein
MTTQTDQIVQGTPGYMSQNQISEFIVSNMLISKIGNVLNNNFELSPINILKLFLLLSSCEIKNSINSLFEYFISFLKTSPQLLINSVLFLSNFLRKRELPEENRLYLADNNQETININVDSNFMIYLCSYILQNKNCLFEESIVDIIIKNTKENYTNKKMDNIIIDFDDYKLELMDNLNYTFDMRTDEITLCNVGKSDITTINNYCDLLTTPQKNIVKQIYQHLLAKAANCSQSVEGYIRSLTTYTLEKAYFSEETIVELLVSKYPLLKLHDTYVQIMIVATILYKYNNCVCIDGAFDQLRATKKMLFDRNTIYDFSISYKKISTNINNFVNKIDFLNILQITDTELKNIFMSFTVPIDQKVNTDNVKNYTNTLLIHPKNDYIINQQDIIDNFVKTIYGSYKKNTTKTKVYFVKLEDDITKKESPNPEYEQYEIKKKMVESLKITNEDDRKVFTEFLNMQIPCKNIIIETIKKKIECKQLNEIEKDFNTLFLRQEDKNKLTNSLDMFKNKGHILKEMGLQNKFNLLLYGKPGTGKSTTILATANYLQKDIYYVDLQKAELNEDLQMIFEYVNKSVQNGGIVVIEDIDCMTDIVLKRTGKVKEYKVNDLINNQKNKLTLEYLLNILQGTLSTDNSVFIVTTNHIDHLDPAFYRDGRFDVKIELKLCDRFQIDSIYFKMIGEHIPQDILDKILEDTFSPATIIYHIKNYIFDKSVGPEEILKIFYK